jgi:hypothetical protein
MILSFGQGCATCNAHWLIMLHVCMILQLGCTLLLQSPVVSRKILCKGCQLKLHWQASLLQQLTTAAQ